MEFGDNIDARAQQIQGEAHLYQNTGEAYTVQRIELQRASQALTSPAQTQQPGVGIRVIGKVARGEHHTQTPRRIRWEEARTRYPVSRFVHAIQDQDEGASIRQGTGHVVNEQAAPDLFVDVRIARNLLPVEIGKQSHQSGENHTGQVGTKTNTYREVDRGDIRPGK